MEKLANLVDLENFNDRIFLHPGNFIDFLNQHNFCYLYAYDVKNSISSIEIPARTVGAENGACLVRFEFSHTFTKMYTIAGVKHLEELAASYAAATIFNGQFTRIEHHYGERYLELKQEN